MLLVSCSVLQFARAFKTVNFRYFRNGLIMLVLTVLSTLLILPGVEQGVYLQVLVLGLVVYSYDLPKALYKERVAEIVGRFRTSSRIAVAVVCSMILMVADSALSTFEELISLHIAASNLRSWIIQTYITRQMIHVCQTLYVCQTLGKPGRR